MAMESNTNGILNCLCESTWLFITLNSFFIKCVPACHLPLFLTMLLCLQSLILTSCCHLNHYLPCLLTLTAFIPLLFHSTGVSKKSMSMFLNCVISIIFPRIREKILWLLWNRFEIKALLYYCQRAKQKDAAIYWFKGSLIRVTVVVKFQ